MIKQYFLKRRLARRQEEFTTGKGFEPEEADRLMIEIKKLERQIEEMETKKNKRTD